MSLPEDPKERIKIFILAGIMGITVIAVLVMFVVKPRMARKAEIREERVLIEDELRSMRKVVARMVQGRVKNHATLKALVTLSEHGEHILQPRFGRNYLLVAQDLIQRAARENDVEVTISEKGFSSVPRNPRLLTKSMLKYYNLQVQIVDGGLREAVALTRSLEAISPYLNIADVTVVTTQRASGQHNISMRLEWPVWAAEDTMQSLKSQVEELDRLSQSGNRPVKLKTQE